MEYGNQTYPNNAAEVLGRFKSAGNITAGANATADKPRIQQQIDQLGKVLTACHQTAHALERVADRLLGPVPENEAKDAGRPPAGNIEQRLAEAIGYAEMLEHRLMGALRRLDSAV